jgi:hypothetical protein
VRVDLGAIGMRVAQLPCAPASAGTWNDKELKP